MKNEIEKANLNHAQLMAINEAENGMPLRLIDQIVSLEETMIRLAGPVEDNALGRWTLGQRRHYGSILGQLKDCAKRCRISLKGKPYARTKSVQRTRKV